jgi:hyperosmotically inducible protein
MRTHQRIAGALLAVTLALAGARADAQTQKKNTIEEIRQELMQLPYYSVFDYLAFGYDKGTVTLVGYAYHSGLKADAVRAVKRASGVDTVVDKIEELSASPNDDELRWKVYYAIYRDPFLSRYAPGGGMLWGHRDSIGADFHGGFGGRFPGTEPLGDFPIHIVVKNGRVTLLGVVDTGADKNVAGMKARGVPGSFGLDNELVVESANRAK